MRKEIKNESLLMALNEERVLEITVPEYLEIPYVRDLVHILNGFALRHFSYPEEAINWLKRCLDANETLHGEDYWNLQDDISKLI